MFVLWYINAFVSMGDTRSGSDALIGEPHPPTPGECLENELKQ